MSRPVHIGNAQGFWGDQPGAAARLISEAPNLDYLTLDYLAEVSLSIMAIQREKDPKMGYAFDFVEVVESLVSHWKRGSGVKVVTNAGGLNPLACAEACVALLRKAGCPKRIAVVTGDDVLPLMEAKGFVTANAYLGAKPLVEGLKKGADIIITGRVADPSLTVAPCVYHHGWNWDAYDQLAGATVAGHLIECGTQVTGGISTDWLSRPNPVSMGFPIAEVAEDGSCVITKSPKSGGCVDIQTVKEQLLYEIGDPECYLSPDVTVSFLTIHLHKQSQDHILVSGTTGGPPPNTYKVSATYRAGYKAEGILAIFGADIEKKAKLCGEILLERVRQAGFKLERSRIECIGGDVGKKVPECMLRVAVADSRREAVECFSKYVASLVTSGPQGVTGYTTGRPKVRPLFGFRAEFVPVRSVHPQVHLLEVS